MADPAFRSAADLAGALQRRELSSRELLEHFLERVERLNGRINAVVTLDAERARERADAADAALARGESWGALHGLPVTVKDCFETAGLRTTAGAPEYARHVPREDAIAVRRLVEAGAVVFGKTNTPALAADWQTYNALHGTTRNPWDPERSPGGSSGGAAAAIAAGLSGLELGSDIGGSIRLPSHCCGVFGHKPTWGIVPLRGFIPGPPGTLSEDDINVAGPIARAAEDLELALGVLAGPAGDRARGWRLELPPPRRTALRDYRVAVWLDDPDCAVDDAVRDRLAAVAEALRKAGARVDPAARPALRLGEALRLYRRLLAPIVASSFGADRLAALAQWAAESAERAEVAEFVSSATASHLDWCAAHEEREHQRATWAEFFRDYDVLLCPVSILPAIPHDHSEPLMLRRLEVNGQVRPYTDQLGWVGPIGAALLPATVAPAGRTPGGLPVGVQIVAGHLEDRTSIDFARRLADEIGGFESPPGW
ncbi:MAG: amidase [Myxococcota bacterium]